MRDRIWEEIICCIIEEGEKLLKLFILVVMKGKFYSLVFSIFLFFLFCAFYFYFFCLYFYCCNYKDSIEIVSLVLEYDHVRIATGVLGCVWHLQCKKLLTKHAKFSKHTLYLETLEFNLNL